MNAPILALVGPTGVGKTALGLQLATQLQAEIISADSRQVYKSLTIGTAKPTPQELESVPHHFIDELGLDESFSAGRFAEAANARIASIIERGHVPIVVGGSTLYIEALLHGLAAIPATSDQTRRHLMERLQREGAATLFEELRALDPASAASMDDTKSQRIVRALEVYYDTGRPLSYFHANRPNPHYTFRPVVLSRPRAELYERINLRVDSMIDDGLIGENRALVEAGFSPELNPLRTIGYREPMAYLRGEIDYAAMVARLKQNSRRYAKRQVTWFRRRPSYITVDLSEQPLDQIAENMLDFNNGLST